MDATDHSGVTDEGTSRKPNRVKTYKDLQVHQYKFFSFIIATVTVLGSGVAHTQDAARQKPPTFSKEIIRIFQARCQTCHHSGAPFAPMSLTNYGPSRAWAKSIQKKVVKRQMPPWHADSSVREYANDISLPQDEIDTILRWVEARAPKGDPADLPPALTFNDDWELGEPDLVLNMGVDFEVPATGTVPLQFFRIDTKFDEDKWLSALEIRPGNPAVVREVVVYVQNPAEGIEVPDSGALGNGLLGYYSRGATSSIYGQGEGKLIKRGAQIIFAVLYVPNGTETTDRSRVGFKFHDEPVRKHVLTRGIAERGFEIPPHIENFPIYATYSFTEPVTLLSMRPLMHYRGESFKYIAHFPDGRDETLLDVNRYDYNWQRYYYPKKPIELPAGTVLECIAVMNNSHDNFDNPEPHASVRFGDQLLDEKMIGWIDYTLDNEDLTSLDSD